jgi:transposase
MARKRYPSDVTREQFEQIKPLLEGARKQTRPRRIDLYDAFCGVLYVLKSGCQWRMLAADFPQWSTIYAYWRIWSRAAEGEKSLLEEVLKKIGWRGPHKPGAMLPHHFSDYGRPEREEHRYRRAQRL